MPRRWPPDWFWLVLALALRLGFALKLGSRYHQIDELGYSIPAMRLAAEGTFGGADQAIVAPVPVVFFGFFFLLGPYLLWPRLAQAFVSAGTAYVVGRMTRDLAKSEAAGGLALALAAIYPFFVYYSGMVMSETLYLAFTTAGLWALCLTLREGGAKPARAAAAGLALGLAGLCRAEGAPIALLIWLGAAVMGLRGRLAWRSFALAVLCWAAPLFLWCARNKAETGAFSLDTHGGVTLLHGTMLFELNELDTSTAMKAFEETELYQTAQALPPAEQDRLYFRAGLAFMRDNPGRTLAQWGRKFVNFWRFYPRTDKEYHEGEHSDPRAGLSRPALTAISLAFEPALILFGLWGLWRLRERREELFPLGLFLLGTMGVHLVSVSQMRYRLPVAPLLILGAAGAAARLLQSKKR